MEEININQLVVNLEQPRKNFDEEKIKELSETIKEYGIIQPIIVHKIENDKYEIIAGERRYRAAQKAGLKKVPIVIKDKSLEERVVISLLENIQREELNAIEIAYSYIEIMEKNNWTQKQLSQKIGKTQGAVANKLRLIKLPDFVKEEIKNGKITERHGRALLTINQESLLKEILKEILDKKLKVSDTEKLIKSKVTKKIEETSKEQIQLLDEKKEKTKYKIEDLDPKILFVYNSVVKEINEIGISAKEMDLGVLMAGKTGILSEEEIEIRIRIKKGE